MLGKENIREMDCENDVEVSPAESTIRAIEGHHYENRLSKRKLSLENLRVSEPSSTSSNSIWYSAPNDDNTANGISLTDNEIEKRATFFVKTFVEELETKLSEYSKEVKPGSKIRKAGKVVDQIDSTQKALFPPIIRAGTDKVSEGIAYFAAKNHRKKAKRVSMLATSHEDKLRGILVKDGLEIFQSFEEQMTKVIDGSWQRGIKKLAIDAVSRAINYISDPDEKGELHIADIIKGVVLGKSKSNTLAQHLLQKSAKLFLKSEALQPGYQVKDKQSDKTWLTSELYKNTGIKTQDSTTMD